MTQAHENPGIAPPLLSLGATTGARMLNRKQPEPVPLSGIVRDYG